VLSTVAVQADIGDQIFKLLPSDGAEFDWFGVSVGIDGITAIVGAPGDNDYGNDSGSVYLLSTITGQQIAKLLPDHGAVGDFFGQSVGVSGDTAIVGAWGHDDNGTNSGSAYLFDTTTGQLLAELLPDDPAVQDRFGYSVAISRTTAIVGARWDDDNGSESGSAYLFDVATGQQIAKLLPDDPGEYAQGDQFGFSVAISGTTAIVGAYRDDDNGGLAGAAYLFDTTTGQQIAKLLPDDGAGFDHFGYSVAISGATAIVGAPWDDDNGTDTGSAYLFDATTGAQLAKLLADDATGDGFGASVAISGVIAVVGAYQSDDNRYDSGSAYLFDTTTGLQIAKLLPDDGAEGDVFGLSVAISGATAIIGAYHDDDNGYNSGSAYLFGASYCPWDFDGDGAVGPFDLAIVLGFWGPNPGHPADLDGDGIVGTDDLAILLGNWGPCP